MKPKFFAGLAPLAAALIPFYAWAEEAAKEIPVRSGGIHLNFADMLSTVIYGLIGIFLAVVGYFVFDWITPYSLGKELVEDKNVAVAIVVAAILLSVAIIVSAAMR